MAAPAPPARVRRSALRVTRKPFCCPINSCDVNDYRTKIGVLLEYAGQRCCRDSFKVDFWSSTLELYKLCRPWRAWLTAGSGSRCLREWRCLAGRRWDHMPRLRAGPIPLNAFTDRLCDGQRPLPTLNGTMDSRPSRQLHSTERTVVLAAPSHTATSLSEVIRCVCSTETPLNPSTPFLPLRV